MNIQQPYRLGKVPTYLHPRPVRVHLMSTRIKQSIMLQRVKLRGTKIYLYDDLPTVLRIREAENRKMRLEAVKLNSGKRLQPQSSEENGDSDDKIVQERKKLLTDNTSTPSSRDSFLNRK